jgi:hypothetical protein
VIAEHGAWRALREGENMNQRNVLRGGIAAAMTTVLVSTVQAGGGVNCTSTHGTVMHSGSDGSSCSAEASHGADASKMSDSTADADSNSSAQATARSSSTAVASTPASSAAPPPAPTI